MADSGGVVINMHDGACEHKIQLTFVNSYGKAKNQISDINGVTWALMLQEIMFVVNFSLSSKQTGFQTAF